MAKCDQDPAYPGPAEYARACREAFAQERRVGERMGLLRTES
ncbi:MAG: hypothetical protein AB1761_10655 [Pseudomonadota bacterium]